jgi:hypothetical protein
MPDVGTSIRASMEIIYHLHATLFISSSHEISLSAVIEKPEQGEACLAPTLGIMLD